MSVYALSSTTCHFLSGCNVDTFWIWWLTMELLNPTFVSTFIYSSNDPVDCAKIVKLIKEIKYSACFHLERLKLVIPS